MSVYLIMSDSYSRFKWITNLSAILIINDTSRYQWKDQVSKFLASWKSDMGAITSGSTADGAISSTCPPLVIVIPLRILPVMLPLLWAESVDRWLLLSKSMLAISLSNLSLRQRLRALTFAGGAHGGNDVGNTL